MPNISIDYALMEKSDNIAMVELQSDWKDLGSWKSIYEVSPKDENNNVIRKINCISVDSNNNILVSDGNYQNVSLLGVHNMIVALTKDNILICDKSKNQDIKKILKLL